MYSGSYWRNNLLWSLRFTTPLHLLLKARDRGLLPPRNCDQEDDAQHRIMTKTRALAMLIRAGADVRAQTGGGQASSSSSEGAINTTTVWPEMGARGGARDTPLQLALLQAHGHEPDMLLTIQFLFRHSAADARVYDN